MSPKKAYEDQRRHAESRSIPWLFTYEEWLELWLTSGKWLSRGRSPDQFCMCRFGDEGPYSIKNCFIATNKENLRQRWEGREKITNDLASKICEVYLSTTMSQRDVGKMFGVDQSYVSRIVNKKRKRTA